MLCKGILGKAISIHALREEGDGSVTLGLTYIYIISIHALREEGDRLRRLRKGSELYFYPRPPRGGRPAQRGLSTRHCYFYPRPPRGGRHVDAPVEVDIPDISIHALREEGDKYPVG